MVKNAMNGIETLDMIKECNYDIQVVLISIQDKMKKPSYV